MTALDHLAWRDGPPDLPAEGETTWWLVWPRYWPWPACVMVRTTDDERPLLDALGAGVRWISSDPWPAGWRCAPLPDGAEEARLRERVAQSEARVPAICPDCDGSRRGGEFDGACPTCDGRGAILEAPDAPR